MSIAERVSLLVLDADGVMTDGAIVYSDSGEELKSFNVRDGFGVRLWHEAGGRCAIVTSRGGGALRRRADELGIAIVVERAEDKAAGLREAAASANTPLETTAYLGDDWPDLPAMLAAGYPMAVADAHPAVLARARFITAAPGGRGAVRDAVEHLLTVRGILAQHLRRYDAPQA